jgi:acylpyruvate hydrolase
VKLATIRLATGTAAVRIDASAAVETGHRDVGELLNQPDWHDAAAAAHGAQHDLEQLDFAPVVPTPSKIVCVGLNYRTHIAEMGRDIPKFPTLFAKYGDALIGAQDDITLPRASAAVDWEAELAVVIGAPVRHANRTEAQSAIGGYSVLNDVTARDWQHRTLQWLQGKNFEATTPLGPYLLTADAFDIGSATIEGRVDGVVVQAAALTDLVFNPADLVAYISTMFTLRPGDLIATGTPGGVGHARDPKRYLSPGATLTTTITGLGQCVNVCRSEVANGT